jgi:hypothetical protein
MKIPLGPNLVTDAKKKKQDCEWARTHPARSWAGWASRNWHKWFRETAARRKVLEKRSIPAKSTISAHPAKASSARPKRVETVMLTSSDDDESDEQIPQAIAEANTVEDSGNTGIPVAKGPDDDRRVADQSYGGVLGSRHGSARSSELSTIGRKALRLSPTKKDSRNTLEAPVSKPSSKVPEQGNQPVAVATQPLLRPPPPLPVNHSRSHLGFACWRRRPRVLVADSDPSQTTATTQTTNLGPTQPTSIPAILASQRSRLSIQDSKSISQQAQIQSQRSSQAASGQNPWIVPDGEDSDGDYSATHHSFDESDDDGWSENSSDDETEVEDPESLLHTGTVLSPGSPVTTGKRHSSLQSNDGESTGFQKLVDKHLPGYFNRAILEYGETQSQTQTQTQATQQSPSQRWAARGSQTGITLSSQQQQKRRRIVNSVLSLVSHWMQIPLPKVRKVWKSLPWEKRTFEELQKKCLQCDLSTSRKEYDATGLFTQQSPRSRVRKWDDGGGPSRKKRKLTTFPPLRRGGSSNTEAEFDGDEESEIYFGGQDPDAPAARYDGEEDEEDDGADQEPPPILFRQTLLVPPSAKSLHPYPTRPDKEWARRICRVLAATYGWRRASKVYEIWEEFGGDAKRVERSLKDKSAGVQGRLLDLGLGDIPRPWV